MLNQFVSSSIKPATGRLGYVTRDATSECRKTTAAAISSCFYIVLMGLGLGNFLSKLLLNPTYLSSCACQNVSEYSSRDSTLT